MVPGAFTEKEVRVYRYNDSTLRFECRDSNNKIIPLTGARVILVVKSAFNAEEDFIRKDTANPLQGAIYNASKGLVDFYILPADTTDVVQETTYVYDVTAFISGKRYTGAVGNFIVQMNVNITDPEP